MLPFHVPFSEHVPSFVWSLENIEDLVLETICLQDTLKPVIYEISIFKLPGTQKYSILSLGTECVNILCNLGIHTPVVSIIVYQLALERKLNLIPSWFSVKFWH